MRSIFCAISALLRSWFFVKKDQTPPKPEVPVGYTEYKFNCWLCGGETGFGGKTALGEKYFTIDCSRCGVENRVHVQPKLSKK